MRSRDIDIIECEGVYPPSEDSYLLLDSIEINAGESFLDIGTGTGIIAIAAAREGANVTATDISEEAVECARKNAKRNGVDIEIVRTSLADGLKGGFDAVSFNAPYLPMSDVEYGPIQRALESEKGGSAIAEEFVEHLPDIILPGGRAYLVLSSLTDMRFLEKNNVKSRQIAKAHIFFEDIYVFVLTISKDL